MRNTIRFALPFIPILIAGLAILGWNIGNDDLEASFLPFAGMNTSTATGIILLAFGVLVYQPLRWPRRVRVVGFCLASAVVMGGAFQALRILGVLMTDRIDAFTTPEGFRSMLGFVAPNTSVDFILLGLATIIARLPARRRSEVAANRLTMASQSLAVGAALIALLALTGHLYNNDVFTGVGAGVPMTINAAICFILLAQAVLRISPGYGLMRYISNPGPAGSMAKFMLPVSVCAPIGLGWLRILGMRLHLYNAEFGVSLSVMLNVVLLFVVTFVVARKLYQTDQVAREAERELLYRATHDSLTGLVTRAVFREQLMRRLTLAARRRSPPFAVFYLDLDGFKQVNDRLGHDAGDRLLVQVADTLRACTRASDTVARLGGDEFVILFEELDTPSDAKVLADRILASMPTCFGQGDKIVQVGISIGVAINAPHDMTPDEILRDADMALYRAKTKGKGRYEMA